MYRIATRLILFILLAATFAPSHSQLALGVNAGINRMKFTGDPPKGFGIFVPQAGFSTSLQLDYRFNDAFSISIQPGIGILRSKYVVLNDSGTSVIDSSYFTMKSFSLPIHAVVWSENGRFYVTAGFEFTYTLDFKGKIALGPAIQSSPEYQVTDYNIYAQFGAGFIVPLGRPYLSFEFRYSQGLNDLTEPIIHQDSFLPRTKMTNTFFLIGIHVPIGDYDNYKLRKHR
ncbi:MAG TPA: PorT family protein [Bacteroides sp.]|nr:PorT family protein [Bacteroides sp.]